MSACGRSAVGRLKSSRFGTPLLTRRHHQDTLMLWPCLVMVKHYFGAPLICPTDGTSLLRGLTGPMQVNLHHRWRVIWVLGVALEGVCMPRRAAARRACGPGVAYASPAHRMIEIRSKTTATASTGQRMTCDFDCEIGHQTGPRHEESGS